MAARQCDPNHFIAHTVHIAEPFAGMPALQKARAGLIALLRANHCTERFCKCQLVRREASDSEVSGRTVLGVVWVTTAETGVATAQAGRAAFLTSSIGGFDAQLWPRAYRGIVPGRFWQKC